MTSEQKAYLGRILPGRKVDDLGCGPTRRLQFLEAQVNYLGLDREPSQSPNTVVTDLENPEPELLRHDVAFIAWPINRRSIDWKTILPEYIDIFYVGTNHSGNVCGDGDLWDILRTREVLKVIPDRRETLIHYGKNPRQPNANIPSEEALGYGVWRGEDIAPYPENKYV